MQVDLLDNPNHNDNRNYNYSGFETVERKEYDVIANWIKPNTSVIDLACGNGTLLEKLIKEKNIYGKGIELSDSGIAICKKKNLEVQKGSIDQQLPFEDNAFDYAICNVTIQMVMYPEKLLSEMKRIAKYQIVSFPNFGHYKNRIDLLLKGRMPEPMLFGYKWYSTGHIHQLSIKDFYELMEDVGGLKILKRYVEGHKNIFKNYLLEQKPNLFQILGIFMLGKND
ncbi:MAG: methyltransferase domain-containing protein [Ignavibacteriaceae bacterium]|nr:methyltransferase domain-containing protein [Ignavibacteriaceae bacterium]